ncbi:MAG TPA: alpha/beta hydrolase [Bacillota bacterium]|nr:alpha/beta hydrolase [Bacillota bacterium]
MKTVLFVPGFMEDYASRDYETLLAGIGAKGYRTQFVPIAWRRTVIDDWVQELHEVYRTHNPKQTVLAGFSFGAMVALMAASQRQPAALWLCSLSPFFAEDMPDLKVTWLHDIGERRAARFRKLPFSAIVPKVDCPILLVGGANEVSRVAERRNQAATAWPHAVACVAPDCAHDVTNAHYRQTLLEHI